ncbi:MAG: AI-2E family transporter, partial [Clostridiales bacterium]|nr:AI-2E family transporter [Clostridiales bacterium]
LERTGRILSRSEYVRQFLEPRVIGRAAGVHPFLALAGAYLGFRLAGPAGILLAPIVLGAMGRGTPGEKRR